MVRRYFTFGSYSDKVNKYVIVDGSSEQSCREEMFKLFDLDWHMMYNSRREVAGLEYLDYIRVKKSKYSLL